MLSHRLCALAALSFILAGCANSATPPRPNNPTLSAVDQNFITGATEASNAEIAAAKLTLTKSSNPDVIAFAQEMITQHTQEENALVPVGTDVNFGAPVGTQVNPVQAKQAQVLAATPEPAYDGVYINGEITGHQLNIQTNYTPEIAHGTNAEVVSYAKTYLPQVTMHLQMAQSIKTKYGF